MKWATKVAVISTIIGVYLLHGDGQAQTALTVSATNCTGLSSCIPINSSTLMDMQKCSSSRYPQYCIDLATAEDLKQINNSLLALGRNLPDALAKHISVQEVTAKIQVLEQKVAQQSALISLLQKRLEGLEKKPSDNKK